MRRLLCRFGFHTPLRVIDEATMRASSPWHAEFQIIRQHRECLHCKKPLPWV